MSEIVGKNFQKVSVLYYSKYCSRYIKNDDHEPRTTNHQIPFNRKDGIWWFVVVVFYVPIQYSTTVQKLFLTIDF